MGGLSNDLVPIPSGAEPLRQAWTPGCGRLLCYYQGYGVVVNYQFPQFLESAITLASKHHVGKRTTSLLGRLVKAYLRLMLRTEENG